MKKNRKKKQPLFLPDDVATTISLAIHRDLSDIKQEYDVNAEDSIAFAATRQRDELLKKFVTGSGEKAILEERAYDKFRTTNAHLGSYREIVYPDSSQRLTSKTPYSTKVLLRARALMHQVLSPFTVEEWFEECRNSSGSSIGVSFVDTSEEAKFTLPISCTKRVKPLLQSYLTFDHSLKVAIETFNGDNPVGGWYDIVEGSRATTVDKNDDIRRMIAVEPTGNMYFQQGLMAMLYKRMKEFGLDVESLPHLHQKLAKESSVTGRNATIDWSSASDCVMPELLRWLTPPKWFDVIDAVRSPTMSIENNNVELNMISTMGNAVTFPLETLVFWVFGHAVRLSLKPGNTLFPEWKDLSCISVFGDDCIVPSWMAVPYMESLTAYGFIVNKEKSFYGPEKFRESCGGDFLRGEYVRPFCLKVPTAESKSALEPWLYIILNSLIPRYIQYFGDLRYVYDRELFRFIFGLFEKHNIKLKVVPPYFPDDSGLKQVDDLQRIARCYPITFSRVSRDSQTGGYAFNFCRYMYKQQRAKDMGLRYALELKFPRHSVSPPTTWSSRKEIGGYVVAKGLSSCWTIPTLET